jgi:predicted O-methyltransferase YrrM
MLTIPKDLPKIIDEAWGATKTIPGYLLEDEAKFLGLLAACTPATGRIVEIGSFKGRSTVILAKVAAHYRLGQVVAIDPHNFNLSEKTLSVTEASARPASTKDDFQNSLRVASVTQHVEFHHALSKEVSVSWQEPIRLLWIDGDHAYRGVKDDFDGFAPHVQPGGVIALHDALNAFSGPIRVFVEEILRSKQFGPAGFVHSIAWAQFRPVDGEEFQESRARLAGRASRLIPFVEDDAELRGSRKKLFKLHRSRIPRKMLGVAQWATLFDY